MTGSTRPLLASTPVGASRAAVEAPKPGLTCAVGRQTPICGEGVISLAQPAPAAFAHLVAAQPATTVSGTGQVVVIGVPILIIGLLGYLCKHRHHKASTALLGFVAGVLLAGTALGATLAGGVSTLIVKAFTAIGGLFTG